MARTKPEPCDFCDGHLSPRIVTFDWRRGRARLVIKNVPARVCNYCGERNYALDVMRRLRLLADARRRFRSTLKVPDARFETVA